MVPVFRGGRGSYFKCPPTPPVIRQMNPLIHAGTGLPTALGLCMEHVRRDGRFNMVTEFPAAVRDAYALYTEATGKTENNALTLGQYMAAYDDPSYVDTVATALRGGSLRGNIMLVGNAHDILLQHRHDTAATRRSARLAKKQH
jgi:hypothetical protein